MEESSRIRSISVYKISRECFSKHAQKFMYCSAAAHLNLYKQALELLCVKVIKVILKAHYHDDS